MPRPFADRAFVFLTMWEKLDDDTYFVAQNSTEDPQFPVEQGVIRGEVFRGLMLTRVGATATKLVCYGAAHLGGSISAQINNLVIRSTMAVRGAIVPKR